MLKSLLNKVSYYLRYLYKLIKVSLGIIDLEFGEKNYNNLIEAGFIWLIGTPVILLIAPNLYNPVVLLLLILLVLILSNMPEMLEYIGRKKECV